MSGTRPKIGISTERHERLKKAAGILGNKVEPFLGEILDQVLDQMLRDKPQAQPLEIVERVRRARGIRGIDSLRQLSTQDDEMRAIIREEISNALTPQILAEKYQAMVKEAERERRKKA